MICIVDYGVGNLGSIRNMLLKVGAESIFTKSPDDLQLASKIILPGVGSFDHGVSQLHKLGYYDIIRNRVIKDKIPILGICLGMQLLTEGSEEGSKSGFGFINAFAYRFKFDPASNYKIPHMGWNSLNINKKSKLIADSIDEYRFYFVHSYAVSCSNQDDVLATTSYGYDFVSLFEKDNIIGAQFHPEKSHKFGLAFFSKFIGI